MKKLVALTLVVVMIISSGYAISAAENVGADPNNLREVTVTNMEYAPGQLIVGLKDEAVGLQDMVRQHTESSTREESGVSASDLFREVPVATARDLTAFPDARIDALGTLELQAMRAGSGKVLLIDLELSRGQSLDDAIELLQQNPNVKYVHRNYITKPTGAPAISVIPNDPLTAFLPPMLRIQADKAWGIETGSMTVTIGILDTGIDFLHEDMVGNVDMSLARNTVQNNANVMDIHGHGTHVAGIAGAKGNNGIGVAGVCWDVSLVPVKVNFCDITGNAWTSDLVAGVYYAEYVGLDIINVSYSIWQWFVPSMETAVNNYSGLVIGAAGNSSSNRDNQTAYNADNLILVGNSTINDQRAFDSCFGSETVHLFAPGSSIFSTIPGNGYGFKSGTSMAAPMVAGVAGLIKSQDPSLTAQEIKARILDNVDVLPQFGPISITGGRLNAFAALEAGAITPDDPDYIMELSIETVTPEHLYFFEMNIDHAMREGFGWVYVLSYDNLVFTPHLFTVDSNGKHCASNELVEITYLLDGKVYDTLSKGKFGEFCFYDLWNLGCINLGVVTIRAEMADGFELTYEFRVVIQIIHP